MLRLGYKIVKDALKIQVVRNFANASTTQLTSYQNTSLEVQNNDDLNENLQCLEPYIPGPLEECREDVSHIGPYCKSSFNFASYADRSTTLQKLIQLGVSLYNIEVKDPDPSFLLRLDFEKDVQPYIMFLVDCGVEHDRLGPFLTKNPRILLQDLDDLKTRIRYLRAHCFSRLMISNIISSTPQWLNHSTEDIDKRLGNLQAIFKLRGKEVRRVATTCPKLVLLDTLTLHQKLFAVKEEMGFEMEQIKSLLLEKPSLFLEARTRLVTTFDYLHNVMKLPHSLILQVPGVLQCRKRKIQPRHQFLVELKRAQYDPSKPLYISPLSLVQGSDAEFCINVAKVSTETYNLYLKSL